jgi:small-conductance mechanosensitive channel
MPEITLGAGALAWLSFLISMAIGLALKDLLTTAVSGFLFYHNKNFNEGDHVYINGEEAVINKIGMRQTVFKINNGRGETWLFVYNDKIHGMKLEKVITPKKPVIGSE